MLALYVAIRAATAHHASLNGSPGFALPFALPDVKPP